MVLLKKFAILWTAICFVGGTVTGIYFAATHNEGTATAATKKGTDWATWTALNAGAWEAKYFIHTKTGLKTLFCIEDNYTGNSGGLTMSCNWDAFNKSKSH